MDEYSKFLTFLNIQTGIFIERDKFESLYQKKLEKFIKEKGFNSFKEFYKKLVFSKDDNLLQEVINLFTVNETYFFREKYQFDTLINYVLPYLDEIRPKSESINILCAPVSTGEEIYSITILLLEEGNLIKKRDFLLLGIDIDSKVIQKAKDGIYSKRSVSKLPSELIAKYFDFDGKFYHLKPVVKNAVNFKVVNVLDKYALKRLGMFDVIFSRNMLIYFDEKSKREVIANFYSILKDNGYLFLGHAEQIPENIKLFKRIKIGESFIYEKVSDNI